MEKAFFIAKSGRPGPVLIDIPDNLQREIIEIDKLKSFEIDRVINKIFPNSTELVDDFLNEIRNSKTCCCSRLNLSKQN